MQAAPGAGTEVSLAGTALEWAGSGEAADAAREAAQARREEAAARRDAERLAAWLKGGTDSGEGQGHESREVTAHELLTGSSFALTSEAGGRSRASTGARGR